MKNTGFTLVELMVSLTVFSIVMLISVGTLLTLIDANAKAQALYMATTNLSFALDAMTRDIRMGHYYRCDNPGNHFGALNNPTDPPDGGAVNSDEYTRDCSNGGSELIFTRDWSGYRVGYRLNNRQIEQKVKKGTGAGQEGPWVALTSSSAVDVRNLTFTVANSKNNGGDQEQPTVSIHIQGMVADGIEDDSTTDFDIQTQIISRRLDIL